MLALSAWLHAPEEVGSVEVPAPLAGYEVESARAGDYDWQLTEGGVR